MPDGSIFISYRREDSAGQAGRLYDRLCGHFGKERVFIDVDTIEPGEDFVQVLDTRVRSCVALVTVIGPRWLSSSDENGRRRIDDENDFVRHELAVALKENIRIIPVLVGRAHMPRSADLPGEISDLARRNAVEITDAAFQAGATRIVDALDAILSPRSAAPEPIPLPAADRVLELSPTTQVPSTVRQNQESRARFSIAAIATPSRWDWRVAVIVAFCLGVLALGVAGVSRYLDKPVAPATGVAPEPQTVTTRIIGSVVPVPDAGRPLKVVVDGERGEGATNELGRFAFPVKGRDGDTVRLKIYADGTLLYDDYAMLPGPLTISLRR